MPEPEAPRPGFLAGILALLGCQLAGEALVRLAGVSFPGPVVGMVLFIIVLGVVRPAPGAPLTRAPSALLRHLQLLFIPAGVGIITSLHEIGDLLAPIAAGLWLSWLVGIVAIGWLVQVLLRRSR
jgi:holin-like protein